MNRREARIAIGACLVGAVASGAVAEAKTHYLITSSSQVEPGALAAGNLSAAARRSLRGKTGTQGRQGIQGVKGDQGIQGLKGDKGDKGDTGAAGTARAFAHVKVPLMIAGAKGVVSVSLDTSAVTPTVCVQIDPAVATITPDTVVLLTPDYSATDDSALFAFRRTSAETEGHCPAPNSIGVLVGFFKSAAAGSQDTLQATAEPFYIAVM